MILFQFTLERKTAENKGPRSTHGRGPHTAALLGRDLPAALRASAIWNPVAVISVTFLAINTQIANLVTNITAQNRPLGVKYSHDASDGGDHAGNSSDQQFLAAAQNSRFYCQSVCRA